MRLDVWDRVETYTIGMTPVRRLKIISSANLKLIIFSFQLLILLHSTLKSLLLVASTRHASLNLACCLRLANRPSTGCTGSATTLGQTTAQWWLDQPHWKGYYFFCCRYSLGAVLQCREVFDIVIQHSHTQDMLSHSGPLGLANRLLNVEPLPFGSIAVSLLINLETAQQGRSVLLSDEQRLLFEGREKGFA